MLAIVYFGLAIGFIGYPLRTSLAVVWFYGFIVSFKVEHATGSAGLATVALVAWWAAMGAATVAHIRFEQTPLYRRNKTTIENSHLAAIFLSGLTAVAISMLSDRLAVKMNHSATLFLGIGYIVAFAAAFVVNVLRALRSRVTAVSAS